MADSQKSIGTLENKWILMMVRVKTTCKAHVLVWQHDVLFVTQFQIILEDILMTISEKWKVPTH